MPQSRFTQGQWVLVKDMTEDRMVIETEEFGHIADISIPKPYDPNDAEDYTGEWMANARLLVQAPQMYALLRRVQQLIVAENLMNKYVAGAESPLTEALTKDISVLLRQIDEGGSLRPRTTTIY